MILLVYSVINIKCHFRKIITLATEPQKDFILGMFGEGAKIKVTKGKVWEGDVPFHSLFFLTPHLITLIPMAGLHNYVFIILCRANGHPCCTVKRHFRFKQPFMIRTLKQMHSPEYSSNSSSVNPFTMNGGLPH